MIGQSRVLTLTIAAALVLAACGGENEDSATPTDATAAEGGPDTTVEAATEGTADEPVDEDNAGVGDATDGDDGCDQVLTPAEYESIFGTPAEIKGSSQVCNLVFASDAVGTLQAFSGSKADDAGDALLTQSKADEAVSAGGVLLADDRGYVVGNSAVVRGNSGRVFSIAVPQSLDVPDMQVAMQELAALLVTR